MRVKNFDNNESFASNVKMFFNNHRKTSINVHVHTENVIMEFKHFWKYFTPHSWTAVHWCLFLFHCVEFEGKNSVCTLIRKSQDNVHIVQVWRHTAVFRFAIAMHLYPSHFTTTNYTFILKCSDDTTLLSLLGTQDEPSIHQYCTGRLVKRILLIQKS